MFSKKAPQALAPPTPPKPFPSRHSSLRIETRRDLPVRVIRSTTSLQHFEPMPTLEPTLETDTDTMTPFLEEAPPLSSSPPHEEHADFSMFKWNENVDMNHEDSTIDDYQYDQDADMDADSTSDYIDQYLDELELDLDISYALLDDAMATCVAIHSPGKPKLIDIPPSPSTTSPDSELSYGSSTEDQTHRKSESTSSSYFSPSSTTQSGSRRASDVDRKSESSYSPLTPRSSTWSIKEPAIVDQETQVAELDQPLETPSTISENMKSPFTPYAAVFASQGETYSDAKMAVRDTRKSVTPIQIPAIPKETSLWKQAKAHARGRKKSISSSWFR